MQKKDDVVRKYITYFLFIDGRKGATATETHQNTTQSDTRDILRSWERYPRIRGKGKENK